MIEPLGIVDHAQQGTLLGGLGQQAQDRKSHQEDVGRGSSGEPEDDRQRLTLGLGEAIQPIEHRRTQLMEAGVCQLHLRLHADGANDVEILRRLDEVLEQGRLTDPGLASQDERSAFALPDSGDRGLEHGGLIGPPAETSASPRFGKSVVHGPERMLGNLHEIGLEALAAAPDRVRTARMPAGRR